jgi:hypothetical protein
MKKKKYFAGGGLDPVSLAAMAQQAGIGIIDSLDGGNEYGHQGVLASTMKGGFQLGGVGAAMGYFKAKQQQREDGWRRNYEGIMERKNQMDRSGAIISSNPALVTGNRGAEFYASGGFLKQAYHNQMKAKGGSLSPMSRSSAEVVGPSHEQGGVDLPAFGSEVEGGETLQGDYVFSKRLGFADQHRKLARSIGKIEKKPATPERINSLKALYQSVQALQEQQEAIRQQNNLQ